MGHLSFGILESYQKTLLAIAVAIGTELILGRIFFRKWLHPASAYISGISVGILVRSPAFWPYALCAAISIMSKYVLRVKGRHIWNPSNFGISVHAVSGAGNSGQLEHSVGKLSFAHGGDLDTGLGDHLASATLSYHRHLRGLIHRIRVSAQLD